jgi:cholesterol transport system auxiliary component
MKRSFFSTSWPARSARSLSAGLALVLLAGCGGLLPKPTPQPAFYALESRPPAAGTAARPAGEVPRPSAGPTLVINPPHAAPGFDSQRIIYVREAHKLEYFAHHEWVDTPARMLAPLILAEAQRSGAFHAVVLTPSAAAGDLRLDTEIVRLQQTFGGVPSQVRFTLRAYVVDNATRKVLASREFDQTVPAATDDPYGGVVAANRAVQGVLEQLARFCADAAAGLKRPQ